MQVNYTSYVKPTTFKGSLKKPANKSFNFLNKDVLATILQNFTPA